MSKTISEIYNDYNIMPNLQEHMLRVASVASMLCDSTEMPVDKSSVIAACLLHDMGNIIKSRFEVFPEFVKPQGVEYWQGVKDEYLKKYGSDDHIATYMINKEIGLHEVAVVLAQKIEFSWCAENELSDSFEQKICSYADLRVGPHGVLSLADRVAESRKRYQSTHHDIAQDETFSSLYGSIQNIEKQIFSKSKIKPGEINDESIKLILESLKDFVIK